MRPLSDNALAIARTVRAHGGRAFIVGGWVRDRLLGRDSLDVDIEVFGIPADELRALLDPLGRVDTVGESFTVYKIHDIDVSLPRRESKAGHGHKGFVVSGDPNLSPVEAARRRDFTINAISFDPLTEAFVDPFDGERDLAARILRMVDPATFADDSLRVLRALQLAARFELTLDEATTALARTISLDDLPAERISGEFEKLLLKARRPSIGFALGLDLGIIEQLFPALKTLVDCPQEPEWHPEGDVWVHTLLVVDEARRRIDDLPRGPALAMMLGAVCHDLGKPLTTVVIDGRIRSPDHEARGVLPATTVLDRLNIHTVDGYDVRHAVLGLVAHHLKPSAFRKSPTPVSDGAFRRLAQKVNLDLLARFAQADCAGRAGTFDCSAMDWFIERARDLGVDHRPPEPIVLGRHVIALGLTPGPRVGTILRTIYERQLDGSVTTLEEGLALAKSLIEDHSRP